MAKLPWMHFYPADYVRDTRGLPDFARGIWMDMICYLWDAPKRGTATLPVEMWIAICGTTAANMETALFTFSLANICEVKRECNGHVTVMCRRMIRDEKVREQTRLRVGRSRSKEQSNVNVTQESRSCSGEKLEARSQKLEARDQKEEKKKSVARSRRHVSDDEFESALKVNPAYSHIDWIAENGKMDAWLLNHPGREKTRKFVLNWLNKIAKPLPIGAVPLKPQRFSPTAAAMAKVRELEALQRG